MVIFVVGAEGMICLRSLVSLICSWDTCEDLLFSIHHHTQLCLASPGWSDMSHGIVFVS